jgi:transposase-like protein
MDASALPKTLQEAVVYFSDLTRCQALIVKLRWPDGVACPRCNSNNVRYIGTRRIWQCNEKHRKQQFSAKVGTVMEDSPLGLDKWMVAMWMVANCKNGISSYELARALGITQKTAWFLAARVKLAMQNRSFRPLAGMIEVDESFIGGRARNMHAHKREEKIHGRGSVGKAVVMGLLERHGGKVRTVVIKDRDRETLHGVVRKNVMRHSDVFTDELNAYNGLNTDYAHGVINHAEKYVDGNVHTNGMENFWSLLKRGIHGTYVSIEPFHLFRYLDEQCFRFNNRKASDRERFALVASTMAGRRLTYAELTGASAA